MAGLRCIMASKTPRTSIATTEFDETQFKDLATSNLYVGIFSISTIVYRKKKKKVLNKVHEVSTIVRIHLQRKDEPPVAEPRWSP